MSICRVCFFFFFFQAEDGIRDKLVTGVQTCALPIALVDELNRLVVVADQHPLTSAIDRGGHDVSRTLAANDADVYSTDARTMDQARLPDLDDWIELTAPAPPGADSVAIVLRLRTRC